MAFSDVELCSTPEEVGRTLEKIQYLDDENRLFEYIEDALFPRWILVRLKDYAPEYKVLQDNWFRLCAQWQTSPRQILLVDFLPEQMNFAEHKILGLVCNLLTKYGYVIRNKTELFPCQTCEKALLTQKVHDYLVQHKSNIVPPEWAPQCVSCRSNDVS